jgi:electron transport complex protein RnfG
LAPWRTYRGYNGAMDLSVALGTDGRIRRVDVLRHRETPGLGDQFLRSKTAWLDQFDGRHIADSEIDVWRVSQDNSHFDVMTGATVTSTAVVTGVREALEFARSLRQKDVGQK